MAQRPTPLYAVYVAGAAAGTGAGPSEPAAGHPCGPAGQGQPPPGTAQLPSPPPEPDELADFAAHLAHHVWTDVPLAALVDAHGEDDDGACAPPGSVAELQAACRRAFPITKLGIVELAVAAALLQRLRAHAAARAANALRVLFFTALMLANKTLSDSPYNARSWAKLTGVPVADIVAAERRVLERADWDVLDRGPGGAWAEPAWVRALFDDFGRLRRAARERKYQKRRAARDAEQRRLAALMAPPSPVPSTPRLPPSPPLQLATLHLATPQPASVPHLGAGSLATPPRTPAASRSWGTSPASSPAWSTASPAVATGHASFRCRSDSGPIRPSISPLSLPASTPSPAYYTLLPTTPSASPSDPPRWPSAGDATSYVLYPGIVSIAPAWSSYATYR
ncbi:hypothetical protein DFJ74DRAFT_675560 [Hyaloraphidium curvatum]|nr:hypothetical protein DFJ74DRAFT_675560 [Hyaloraphidium curvatum]